MTGGHTHAKMAYSEEAAVAKVVEHDYALVPRSSAKGEEPSGYYVMDLRTKEPWLILKKCCVCGNDRVWMKQVLISLKDSIDQRVAECPGCRGLLRFKQDGTDLTERFMPEEERQLPRRESEPVQAATLTAGDNTP